jgi:hypothetical protein
MRKSIFMMTAAAALVAGSALAQPAPGGAMQGGMQGGAGRGGFLSQEERAMQFVNQKGMTPEQVQAERTKQRGMSPDDQAKLKASLDAQWAKLSKADQDKAMADMQASFQGRGGAGGGRQGGGQ